jgi:hypothetical protein
MAKVIKPEIYNNPSLDQKQVSSKTPYGQPADKEDEKGKTLADVREKFAPKADVPTTASSKPGELDLPSILKKVDPNNLSSILPSMFEQLGKVNSILNASAPSTRKIVIQDSLTGALYRLNNKYSFTIVMNAFDAALDNNGIFIIDPSYLSVIQTAISNLITAAMQYGAIIPIDPLPEVVYGTVTPAPVVIVVPDLCTKLYYTTETDPYPGYIDWLGSDRVTHYYVRRGLTDYPFSTMEEETKVLGELELAEQLDPYIKPIPTLTPYILNYLMSLQDSYIEQTNMDNNVGKGSGSDIMGMASSLLGDLGGAVNTVTSSLPNTVLNSTGISTALNKFTQNLSLLKKMKEDASSIIQVASSVSKLPTINSIVSSVNIPTEATKAVQSVLTKFGIS